MSESGPTSSTAGDPAGAFGVHRTATAPAGWFADPLRRAPLRYWSGTGWTTWLAAGTNVWAEPASGRRPLGTGDLVALEFVREIFLPAAQTHAQLSVAQAGALLELVDDLSTQARSPHAPVTPTRAPSVPQVEPQPQVQLLAPTQFQPQSQPPTPVRPHEPVAQVVSSPPLAYQPPLPYPTQPTHQPQSPPRPPSELALWWLRTRSDAASDLAVHGLAYLGVLMLFVGMFGLVAFAFGEVTPALRPVAELACAALPFLAARMLRQHGAQVAGRALEVAAGLLVPLMVIASVVDGFPVPPDLRGGALVVVLTGVCVALAAAYALWSRAHPASGLRFLVGPLLMLAAAMGTLGLGRAVPTGEDVAVPTLAQVAAMSAVLVAVLAGARLRPAGYLSAPTLTASIPGTFVLALLAVLTALAQGWPTLRFGLAGIALLVALELLRPRVPERVLDVALPLWWATIALVVVAAEGPPGAALVAMGFVGLVELFAARHRPAAALGLPAAGLAVSLLAVAGDPWWATATFAAVGGWAIVRRTVPFDGAALVLDAAAAVLPVAAVGALVAATDVATALVAGTVLVALATVPATHQVLRRGDADAFWRYWWSTAAVVTAVLAQGAWVPGSASSATGWVSVGVFAVLGALCVVGPVPPVWRPGLTTAAVAWSWFLACAVGSIPDATRGSVLAGAALALVVAGHLAARVATTGVAADRTATTGVAADRTATTGVAAALALCGHLVAVGTLFLSGTGWALVAACAAATAGFVVTAVRDDQDRSPVGAVLGRTAPALRYLPWALAAIGAPVTATLALDLGGALPWGSPWTPAVAVLTALAYALVARGGTGERLVGTATWFGFTAAVLAVGLVRGPWPAVMGLLGVVAFVLIVPGTRRAPVMRWTAWLIPAPLVGVLAGQWSGSFAELTTPAATALTLTGVGTVLLVGAAAADLRGRRWAPRWAPSHRALVPPLVLGGLEVLTGLLLTGGPVPSLLAGVLVAVTAGAALATAVLAKTGSLAGLAALLGWAAALRLTGSALDTRAWVAVLATAALLVAGEALHRLTADRVWWSRWDVPPVLVAAPVALTGLVLAADGDWFTTTYVLTGLLSVAVAIRLHRLAGVREATGWTGTAAILLGATYAGPGWATLALLALGAAHTALSVHASGPMRVIRLTVGAAATVAAWLAALAWFDWSAQQAIDVSALGAGTVAAAVAVAARAHHLNRSATAVWGTTAAGVVAVATLVAVSLGTVATVAPSLPVAVGAALVAVAVAIAAAPLGASWLADVAAAPGLVSLLLGFEVAQLAPAVRVTVLSVLGAAVAVLLLAAPRLVGRSAWLRVAVEAATAAVVVAGLLGLDAMPDAMLLVPPLAAAAALAAATGVAWRSVELQMLSPAVACTAWLVFVANAVGGGPQWYTGGVAVTLLTIVALWRRDRRRLGLPLAGPQVVALELTAIAFGVGASFVQALTVSVAHALVAIALGAIVAGWGAATRVRRRVAAGVVVVLAAVVILVVVPLVALLPEWGGASLWILVAVIGLMAVLAGTLAEKARDAARTTRSRVGGLTAGWE